MFLFRYPACLRCKESSHESSVLCDEEYKNGPRQGVASFAKVVKKPSPTPKGGNLNKTKGMPSHQKKRTGDGTTAADTSKKHRVVLSNPKVAIWVPLLMDDKGNHILVGAMVFNDHLLVAHLNRVWILPEDFDTCMALEEGQQLAPCNY